MIFWKEALGTFWMWSESLMKNFHKDGTEGNIIIASCSTLEANFVHDGYHYFPLNIRPSSNAQCSCQFHQNLIRGFWTIIKMMIEYFILILLYMCFIVHQNRPKWRIRGMSGYQRSEIVAFTDLSGNSSRVLTQRLGQQYTQKFIEPLPKANTLWVQSLNVWRGSELYGRVSCKARAGLLSSGRELGWWYSARPFQIIHLHQRGSRLKIKSVGRHKTLFEDAPTHVFTLISSHQKCLWHWISKVQSLFDVWWPGFNVRGSQLFRSYAEFCIYLILGSSSLFWCLCLYQSNDIGKNSPPWYWADTAGKILWDVGSGSEKTERSLGRMKIWIPLRRNTLL